MIEDVLRGRPECRINCAVRVEPGQTARSYSANWWKRSSYYNPTIGKRDQVKYGVVGGCLEGESTVPFE